MRSISSANLPEKVRVFSYDRDAVEIGIVHFGIGNFHRAHQAIYVEELLENGATQWGIAGVSLRSATVKEALKPQNYIYTLAVLGEQTEYRVIGAIKDILVAPHSPQLVIDLIAEPKTQLVSSTITEKGYYLSSGQIDFEHPALKVEWLSLETPTTIYGFLTRGLIARYQNAPTAKLTIMCCDNISGGGEWLEAGVKNLLGKHHPEALTWMQSHVSFISTMVDRVSPATDNKLRETIAHDTGRRDAAPVSAEPFSQWIVEDNFAGDRPNFDKVGAVFIDDIAPFERMKLRYLNAAHTIVSTLGYLFGTNYVHEALLEQDIFTFTQQTLYENILPHADVPEGYDGAQYIKDIITRFQNENLPYANLQVGTDSSQKIQQRWFPTIEDAVSQGNASTYFAFCLASWVVFIRTALENEVLSDPMVAEFKQVDTQDEREWVRRYLEISKATNFKFFADEAFMTAVVKHVKDMRNQSLQKTLNAFLTKHSN